MDTIKAVLPCGIRVGDQLYREVELSPLTGVILKSLTNTLSNIQLAHRARRVALKTLLKSIRGFEGTIDDELLLSMYAPDVEYILFKVVEEDYAGEPATLVRSCVGPLGCGRENVWEFDLSEVQVIDLHSEDSPSEFSKYEDFMIPFTLERGLPVSLEEGAPVARHGKLQILTLRHFEKLTERILGAGAGAGAGIGIGIGTGTAGAGSGARARAGSGGGGGAFGLPGGVDYGEARFLRIYYSIGELEYFHLPGQHEEGKVLLDVDDLDRLHIRDIRMLEELYARNEPGPKSPLPTFQPCEYCGNSLLTTPDWLGDFFLGPPGT